MNIKKLKLSIGSHAIYLNCNVLTNRQHIKYCQIIKLYTINQLNNRIKTATIINLKNYAY